MNFYSARSPGQTESAAIRLFLPVMILAAAVFCLFPAGRRADAVDRETRTWRIEADRWPAAEAIFHSDSRWLGGDGATSVDLGDNRVLWLFGDSFVDADGTGARRSSTLVRNTIAVQTGYDPADALLEFAWKKRENKPAAFFQKSGDHWYWPASGILLGRHLLVFLMEIQAADNDLGFESCGWKAAWIDNPREAPGRWNITWLISPQRENLVVGSGNPILEKGFLLAFAANGETQSVYLARWPEAAARAGTLTAPQWWAGEETGWADAREDRARPEPVFTEGQIEFSVAYRPAERRYLRVQTGSFLNPCLAFATAPALTGPWSDGVCFFTPPEQGDPDLLIYAGKFHPALRGAEMVFSYVVNTTCPERILSDMAIYFPVLLQGRIISGPSSD